MKQAILFQQRYLLAAVILAIIIGCTKDKIDKPPLANVVDYILAFPGDTVLLDGRRSSDLGGQIISYEWKKISGPPSFSLKNEHSPVANVTELQGGIYQFELSVSDNSNQHDEDTVTVDVFELGPGAREVNFKSLQWNDFWGYYLEINNFHSFVPATAMFRIFVKTNDFSGWTEVKDTQQSQNQNYQYGLSSDGNLWIDSYGNETGTADVKIVF